METIDVTPTWVAVLPIILDGLTSRAPSAVALAMAELQRMAEAADAYNAIQQLNEVTV